ncbi:MAG: FkbM family methyltransferase, partial [Pseudomonadota bacterium]|nr:FkbM family methyltransferase [Pseudomonadota bacterium]
EFCSLHMSKIQFGGSLNSVDEMLDCNLKQQSFSYEQDCITYCLDTLIAEGRFPIPTHIKIDVDGIEHKVIGGALEVLSNPNVKSLLVEVDPRIEQHKNMIGTLSDLGFCFSEKQVAKARRKEGPFIGVAEYIFRR